MKKIAYMLAGLLLLAVALPVKAEIKENSSAMAAVCKWAAGHNLAAAPDMVANCAAVGVNLGAKPAGAGSLSGGEDEKEKLMQAFYDARDNAYEAWQAYLAAKDQLEDIEGNRANIEDVGYDQYLAQAIQAVWGKKVSEDQVSTMMGAMYDLFKLQNEMERIKRDEFGYNKYEDLMWEAKLHDAGADTEGADKLRQEAQSLKATLDTKWESSAQYQSFINNMNSDREKMETAARGASKEVYGDESHYQEFINSASSSVPSYYSQIVYNGVDFAVEAQAEQTKHLYEIYEKAASYAGESGKEAGEEYIPPHEQGSEEAKK